MNAAARKIQEAFRKKHTNSGLGFRMTKPKIISTVAELNVSVNFKNIYTTNPKGFDEVTGYVHLRAKPRMRYTGGEWIGSGPEGCKYFIAKTKNMTIVMTPKTFKVSGVGKFLDAYIKAAKNGWVSKYGVRTPKYKIINGKFSVNHTFDLPVLANYLNHNIPKTMLDEKVAVGLEELRTPALVARFKKPKFTYQFFKNGTILFSGIKKLSDIDVPPELFRQFFTKYEFYADDIFGGAPKARAQNRNPSAGTWNKLVSPVPKGYYIRPGANGQPRLYPYQYYSKLANGPYILENTVNLGPLATKVKKAFKDIGQNIPQSTLNVFRNAGHPLNKSPVAAGYAGPAERRAPGWNATHPGFYVRPGAGGQPYWYSIPKGKAAGRKTVIAAYTKAGRNIPAAVRAIFKISNNVKINNSKKVHEYIKGANGILRINGKQATRLTKAELVAIARNEKIAEVNNKMKPANIIAYLTKRKMPEGLGTYNVNVGSIKYKFLANARVRRLKPGKQPTTRDWSTMKPAERSALVNRYINKENKANFAKKTLSAQYAILYEMASKGPKSASSTGSSLNLTNVYGTNYVRNENFG
jgi:hypothetical protein